MKRPVSLVAKQLSPEYAHQSVQIEDNRLRSEESYKIRDFLNDHSFHSTDVASLSLRDLAGCSFPEITRLGSTTDKPQINELRNHIVVSQWIAETAAQHPGTDGLDETDVKHLSALTMKDLGQDGYFPYSWGQKVRLGQYRSIPIGVKSNPLAVFPYHAEVPACMRRFFEWRGKAHQEKKLHPLILACQSTVYFLSIHPFPDGNGRVSRMMMHDYMVRQGYMPVVMQGLERQHYLKMIRDAADGEPDEFVNRVLTTQLEQLVTFRLRDS